MHWGAGAPIVNHCVRVAACAYSLRERLERWFADTERFSRQLREVAHDDYITMKRGQYLRQQAVL